MKIKVFFKGCFRLCFEPGFFNAVSFDPSVVVFNYENIICTTQTIIRGLAKQEPAYTQASGLGQSPKVKDPNRLYPYTALACIILRLSIFSTSSRSTHRPGQNF